MSIRNVIITALLLLLFVLGSACSNTNETGGNDSDDKEGISLKLAHVGSDSHQYNIASEKFKELVEEQSKGSIHIEIHGNATLGSEADAIEQVMDGSIEITTVAPDSSFANTVPEMNIFGIPYLFQDREHVYSVLDGEIGEQLFTYVDQHQMKGLGWWEVGFRHLTNNKKEIKTPEDMKSLKIRVQPSPVWEVHMKSLNASPTPVDFNELYSALDQGLVDGQENPLPTIDSMKFYEVQQYVSLTAHTYNPAIVVINQDVWESLNEEQQQILQDAVDETTNFIRKTLEEQESEIIKKLEDHSVTITEPDRELFKDATKEVREAVKEVPEELIEKIEKTK